MDFVFTVCDNAAGETCPICPEYPMTAHWGIRDPSRAQGMPVGRARAFVTAVRYRPPFDFAIEINAIIEIAG